MGMMLAVKFAPSVVVKMQTLVPFRKGQRICVFVPAPRTAMLSPMRPSVPLPAPNGLREYAGVPFMETDGSAAGQL